LMGSERRSMVMSSEETRLTAYHEAGHAIVGLFVPDHDPVYKVTVIPRGRALGVTMYLPEQDRYSYSRQRLMSRLKALFGGRLAEEIIFGKDHVTTGASNDIERATEMARNMVTKWGLSEKLGPMTYNEEQDEVFLGRAVSQNKEISNETARMIDEEVRAIIDQAYKDANQILHDQMDLLHAMAKALIKYETIDEQQIQELMEGKDPTPPEGWDEAKEQNSKDAGVQASEEAGEVKSSSDSSDEATSAAGDDPAVATAEKKTAKRATRKTAKRKTKKPEASDEMTVDE